MGLGPTIALSIFMGLIALVYFETTFKKSEYNKWTAKQKRAYGNSSLAIIFGSAFFPWFLKAYMQ